MKKISKIQPNPLSLTRFLGDTVKRLLPGMRVEKAENDISSDGHNFFLKRAISNLDAFLETWDNSEQHM